MKERVSKLTYTTYAPTLLENALYNEWQFQASDRKPVSSELHKIILAKILKGY